MNQPNEHFGSARTTRHSSNQGGSHMKGLLIAALTLSMLALTACPEKVIPPIPTPPAPPAPPPPALPAPPPPATTYFVGVDANANNLNTFLRRTGESSPYSSATVTINGVNLPFTPYDYYYARPDPALGPGDTVKFKAIVPEGEIKGSGVMPDRAKLTAPPEGVSLNTTLPLTIKWDSPSNPSEFRLIYYRVGDSMAYSLGQTTGDARSFDVPAGTLPANTRIVCVYSLNSGRASFTGPVSSDSTFELSGKYACVNFTTASAIRYEVKAGAGSAVFLVEVRRDGETTPFSTATVTMNGRTLPFNATHGVYYVEPSAALTPGASVEVRVTVPEGVIVGRATVPDRTTLTAPTMGASINPAAALRVEWTNPGNPDAFWLGYGTRGEGGRDLGMVAGSARHFTIPAGTLPMSTAGICAFAVNYGTSTLTGPFLPGSILQVGGQPTCNGVTTVSR